MRETNVKALMLAGYNVQLIEGSGRVARPMWLKFDGEARQIIRKTLRHFEAA
jgi:hypothetical protein